MKAVCIVIIFICGPVLLWMGLDQIFGKGTFPFSKRSTNNLTAFVCFVLLTICNRLLVSKDNSGDRKGTEEDQIPTYLINNEEVSKQNSRKGDGTGEIAQKPNHEQEPVRRFRLTTARENGTGTEIHDLDAPTKEEATAFAMLSGLTVVSVEELTQGERA